MQNAPTAGEGEGEDAREAEAEAQDTLAELPAEEPDAVHSNPLMDADSIAKAAEKKPKFNASGMLPEADFESFGWNLPDPDHIVTIETDFIKRVLHNIGMRLESHDELIGHPPWLAPLLDQINESDALAQEALNRCDDLEDKIEEGATVGTSTSTATSAAATLQKSALKGTVKRLKSENKSLEREIDNIANAIDTPDGSPRENEAAASEAAERAAAEAALLEQMDDATKTLDAKKAELQAMLQAQKDGIAADMAEAKKEQQKQLSAEIEAVEKELAAQRDAAQQAASKAALQAGYAAEAGQRAVQAEQKAHDERESMQAAAATPAPAPASEAPPESEKPAAASRRKSEKKITQARAGIKKIKSERDVARAEATSLKKRSRERATGDVVNKAQIAHKIGMVTLEQEKLKRELKTFTTANDFMRFQDAQRASVKELKSDVLREVATMESKLDQKMNNDMAELMEWRQTIQNQITEDVENLKEDQEAFGGRLDELQEEAHELNEQMGEQVENAVGEIAASFRQQASDQGHLAKKLGELQERIAEVRIQLETHESFARETLDDHRRRLDKQDEMLTGKNGIVAKLAKRVSALEKAAASSTELIATVENQVMPTISRNSNEIEDLKMYRANASEQYKALVDEQATTADMAEKNMKDHAAFKAQTDEFCDDVHNHIRTAIKDTAELKAFSSETSAKMKDMNALVIEKVNESSETLMAAVEGVRKFQSDHENMITTLQDEATTTKDLVESNFEANVDRFERAESRISESDAALAELRAEDGRLQEGIDAEVKRTDAELARAAEAVAHRFDGVRTTMNKMDAERGALQRWQADFEAWSKKGSGIVNKLLAAEKAERAKVSAHLESLFPGDGKKKGSNKKPAVKAYVDRELAALGGASGSGSNAAKVRNVVDTRELGYHETMFNGLMSNQVAWLADALVSLSELQQFSIKAGHTIELMRKNFADTTPLGMDELESRLGDHTGEVVALFHSLRERLTDDTVPAADKSAAQDETYGEVLDHVDELSMLLLTKAEMLAEQRGDDHPDDTKIALNKQIFGFADSLMGMLPATDERPVEQMYSSMERRLKKMLGEGIEKLVTQKKSKNAMKGTRAGRIPLMCIACDRPMPKVKDVSVDGLTTVQQWKSSCAQRPVRWSGGAPYSYAGGFRRPKWTKAVEDELAATGQAASVARRPHTSHGSPGGGGGSGRGGGGMTGGAGGREDPFSSSAPGAPAAGEYAPPGSAPSGTGPEGAGELITYKQTTAATRKMGSKKHPGGRLKPIQAKPGMAGGGGPEDAGASIPNEW